MTGASRRRRFHAQADREAFTLNFTAGHNRTRRPCLNYKAPLKALLNHPKDNTQDSARRTAGPGS